MERNMFQEAEEFEPIVNHHRIVPNWLDEKKLFLLVCE